MAKTRKQMKEEVIELLRPVQRDVPPILDPEVLRTLNDLVRQARRHVVYQAVREARSIEDLKEIICFMAETQ